MPDGLYKRKESDLWYADYFVQGRRFRECTGTASKKEARQRREELRAERIAQHSAASAIEGTWQSACVKWLQAEERSASDRYSLRALAYENRPLHECTPASFEAALEHLSPSTFNRYRAIIVAICRLSGHELKMPTKTAKTGRLRFLTREEWQKLHLALPVHLKPIAAFALATGLRQHNVTHLRWEQVDLPGRRLWIHADEAKGGKPIGIPLSTDATAILQSQAGKSKEWVFPYKGRGRAAGGPIGKIKTAWHAALKRAGIEGFTFHGLRHTWASWHLMAGTPIETLAKLGGWSDLRMVQRYAHLAPEHLAQFADNSKPWSNVSHEPVTQAIAS